MSSHTYLLVWTLPLPTLLVHFSGFSATAWFLSTTSESCAMCKQRKEDLGQPSPPFFSSLKNLLGGFTDSDESDSYAGDLVGDSGDLFTRVRRFQGSSGPPGGPGFPAGAPPRRPGFMFPPPPSGPPPEPGDLYSVLQCKEIKSKPKKPKGTNLDLFKFVSNLAQQILKAIDVVAGLNFMNAYEIQKLLIW